MTISDTAGMIGAIDALTVDQCTDTCWCNRSGHDKPARAMRWSLGCEIARFPPEDTS